MDLSIRTEFADHHDAKFTDLGNYRNDFRNLCISVDHFEWKLYSQYFSGYDPDFPDSYHCERRSESKLM